MTKKFKFDTRTSKKEHELAQRLSKEIGGLIDHLQKYDYDSQACILTGVFLNSMIQDSETWTEVHAKISKAFFSFMASTQAAIQISQNPAFFEEEEEEEDPKPKPKKSPKGNFH
jgi:hypothetical protein